MSSGPALNVRELRSAEVHCYTPVEFERKRSTLAAVRAVAERGMLLYEDTGPQAAS